MAKKLTTQDLFGDSDDDSLASSTKGVEGDQVGEAQVVISDDDLPEEEELDDKDLESLLGAFDEEEKVNEDSTKSNLLQMCKDKVKHIQSKAADERKSFKDEIKEMRLQLKAIQDQRLAEKEEEIKIREEMKKSSAERLQQATKVLEEMRARQRRHFSHPLPKVGTGGPLPSATRKTQRQIAHEKRTGLITEPDALTHMGLGLKRLQELNAKMGSLEAKSRLSSSQAERVEELEEKLKTATIQRQKHLQDILNLKRQNKNRWYSKVTRDLSASDYDRIGRAIDSIELLYQKKYERFILEMQSRMTAMDDFLYEIQTFMGKIKKAVNQANEAARRSRSDASRALDAVEQAFNAPNIDWELIRTLNPMVGNSRSAKRKRNRERRAQERVMNEAAEREYKKSRKETRAAKDKERRRQQSRRDKACKEDKLKKHQDDRGPPGGSGNPIKA